MTNMTDRRVFFFFTFWIAFCFFLGDVSLEAIPAEQNTLVIKETIWAKNTDDGRMEVASNGIFRRGETVNLIMREVGKFQQGKDGKCRFEIDMIVKDPTGKIILDQKNLLGEKGHFQLENGIAGSPYGIFDSKVRMLPGVYYMTLTISDKIGGAKATVDKFFTLSGGLSYEKAIFARKGTDETLVPVEDRVFSRGELVNFILINVGKLKRGQDNKNFFDIDMEVKDSNGKIVIDKTNLLGMKGNVTLKDDIAESPYGIFTTTIDMEPGTYIMKLTIRDKIGDESLTVTKPFILK